MFLRRILCSVSSPRLKIVMLQSGEYTKGIAASPKSISSVNHRLDSDSLDYEEAIKALNTLQSNAASIRQSIVNKKNQTTLEDTVKYLNRSGVTLEDLDRLSVIHVSGTKGKGSTCALTESILRAHGIRTGFFSSPHLVSVTERIRINGEAISKKKFTRAFWKVFNKLEKHKESENDLPAYFKFLTILCFHIFLEEDIDVAILEVGIGGLYDCTNIVRNTSTVGITSLGLEHTNILGDTIAEIATQKAGIIKPSSKAYTNVKQLACLKILEEKAAQENAKLLRVPDIAEYNWPKHVVISNLNKMAQLNGSLAIQLANNWLRLRSSKNSTFNGPSEQILTEDISLTISDEVIEGFQNCIWPGRCQAMDLYNFRIHLDGAHTLESMDVCTDWFQNVTRGSPSPKILIFNATGDRDTKALLKILHTRARFDLACFVPNIPLPNSTVGDIYSNYNSNQDQLRRAESHANIWRELAGYADNSRLFGTILEAFSYLQEEYGKENVNVLVTGSLHLLGATVLALEEFGKRLSQK